MSNRKQTLTLRAKRPPTATPCPVCEGWLRYDIGTDKSHCVKCDYIQAVAETPGIHSYPEFWLKGQLLNCRKSGDNYIVTLSSEDFDPQAPERALHFSSSFDAQAFVSWWYNKDYHDPRA